MKIKAKTIVKYYLLFVLAFSLIGAVIGWSYSIHLKKRVYTKPLKYPYFYFEKYDCYRRTNTITKIGTKNTYFNYVNCVISGGNNCLVPISGDFLPVIGTKCYIVDSIQEGLFEVYCEYISSSGSLIGTSGYIHPVFLNKEPLDTSKQRLCSGYTYPDNI